MLKRAILLTAMAAVTAALTAMLQPNPTMARPTYAAATGQTCGVCHINPAGGGPFTPRGAAFAANPIHFTDPAGAWAQINAPTPTPWPTATATPVSAATPAPTNTPAPAGTPAATPTEAPSGNYILLMPGWNLVSVPGPQRDPSIAAVFAQVPPVTKVYTLQNGNWIGSNRVDQGWSGPLTQVVDGAGYNVYSAIPAIMPLNPADPNPMAPPPTYPLAPEWNLIGYTGSVATMPVDSYLNGLKGKWLTLYRLDPVKGWEGAKPEGIGFKEVELGRGYWLYLNAPGTLVP